MWIIIVFMSVYSRFKRAPEGFRQLVELLETTPVSRRQKMIDVGMAEDPEYTERALACMLTFQDVVALPEMELAEVTAAAQPRTIAYAINKASKDVQARFMKCCKPPVAAEVRDLLGVNPTMGEIGGAQLKLVEVTRSLERRGLVKTKRITGA